MIRNPAPKIPNISASHWKEIERLAKGLDGSLRASHSKLAMSCQLCFVSEQKKNEPEWCHAVRGPTKKRFARSLVRRLKTRYARKGIIRSFKHKTHTPTQPLWELVLYWRMENTPIVFETTQSDDLKPSQIEELPKTELNPGLQFLSITPGEGCLYAQLPIVKNWGQLSALVSVIYKQAEECGLLPKDPISQPTTSQTLEMTEQVSPIYVGGITYDSSPFVKQPDFLTSTITYWQNHPSLSYLFSSPSVGPYSNHARLDEHRYDALYELEKTLDYIVSTPLHGKDLTTVLNSLKSFLIGANGSERRAEIGIADLYNEDAVPTTQSAQKHEGCIVLRGFAMAPNEQACLLQMLLIKAIFARLKSHSFHKPLIRWGTKLQNELMLPYFLYQDFTKVLNDLKNHGYAFNEHWFASHFLRRFPKIGKVVLDDVELELSHALEPINIPIASQKHRISSALHYSASLQRLQLRVKALNPKRHLVTCNDVAVPLSEADGHGVRVAALRIPRHKNNGADRFISHNTKDHLVIELRHREEQSSLGGFVCNINNEAAKQPNFIPFAPYRHSAPIHSAPQSLEYPNMLDLRYV
ncbi:MAG: transglutaminase family protein [Pseudomonadota bacterium]